MQAGKRRDCCHHAVDRGGDPIAFMSKWVGWYTDPMRSLIPIELFPVDGEAPDPKCEEFLILALVHPGGNGLLSIFVCGKGGHRVMAFDLSPIPIAPLLRMLEISPEHLLKLCK